MYVNDNPGSLDPKTVFSSLNASVNDAAAKTLSGPLSFDAAVEGVAPDDLLLLSHAATTSAKQTKTDAA
ncbi:MAG: hypothetical protein M3Q30_07560 [Actinomycetota bacterium]|nr:hypothetical protein [Actinomycetota bacterium]